MLANHVPSVEPLKPGVIEVIESAGQSKKWFGEDWNALLRFIAFADALFVQHPEALPILCAWSRNYIVF